MEDQRNYQQNGEGSNRRPPSLVGNNPRPYSVLIDKIKTFILRLYNAIKEGDVEAIEVAYTTEFPSLTEEFFSSQKWPEASVVAKFVDDDEIFLILYRELYYRHIHAHYPAGPTTEERMESYGNYCELFNKILRADSPLMLQLPHTLLWDVVDEFIYQFVTFSNYRARLIQRQDDELGLLLERQSVWNVHSVINILLMLIKKSNINEQLRAFARDDDPNEVAGEFGSHGLYKLLGLFSLVGLSRVHCHLGDYYQSLEVLENIDITNQEMYHEVQQCHITTGYYVGFSYFMMRQYQDSIRILSNLLTRYHRHKQTLQGMCSPEKLEYVTKITEQCYHILCIALTLHPMRTDEVVQQQLKEKYHDKMMKLMKMDLKEFEGAFLYCCPKFISPVIPNFNSADANYLEPQIQQTQIFMTDISEQLVLPNLRSFLKLYSTLPISKLAMFLEKSESEVYRELMCYKHKLQSANVNKKELQQGNNNNSADNNNASYDLKNMGVDLDFFIDGDMIHIADTKVQPNYSEYFLKQISKLHEVHNSINQMTTKVREQRVKQPQNTMIPGSYANSLSSYGK